MKIRSIVSFGLAAAAVAFVSTAPAEAKNNNNQYLNQLAMQMYMQNQAAATNPYLYGGVNAGYPAYNVYNGYPTGTLYGNQATWANAAALRAGTYVPGAYNYNAPAYSFNYRHRNWCR